MRQFILTGLVTVIMSRPDLWTRFKKRRQGINKDRNTKNVKKRPKVSFIIILWDIKTRDS